MKKAFAGAAMFFGLVSANETLSLSIDRIIVESSAGGNNYYFTTVENGGKWGGCSNIDFLWIQPSNTGAKEFYAGFLTAKSAGLKIKATGTCPTTTSLNYLVVTSFDMR